jgi:hypothetical protein
MHYPRLHLDTCFKNRSQIETVNDFAGADRIRTEEDGKNTNRLEIDGFFNKNKRGKNITKKSLSVKIK